jgi:hypothetical protein
MITSNKKSFIRMLYENAHGGKVLLTTSKENNVFRMMQLPRNIVL